MHYVLIELMKNYNSETAHWTNNQEHISTDLQKSAINVMQVWMSPVLIRFWWTEKVLDDDDDVSGRLQKHRHKSQQ